MILELDCKVGKEGNFSAPTLEAAGGQILFLEDKTTKDLAFGRGPSFPNDFLHVLVIIPSNCIL